jgi:hypothetical protein
MKHKINLITILLFLQFLLPIIGFASETPTLTQFDEDVAKCRRVVRDYCAIVQQMMNQPQTDKDLQKKGLALLHDARNKWNAILEKYRDNPPREYSNDLSFKVRLDDFSNALEDMEKALAAGQVRRSFMACGFGCGLFVTMHEDNGLSYALDAIFHLRKSVKTAGSAIKSREVENIRPILASLMQKRDVVIAAPLPWPDGDARVEPYIKSVKQLSQTLDEWVFSVISGNSIEAGNQYKQLLNFINTAYGLAL